MNRDNFPVIAAMGGFIVAGIYSGLFTILWKAIWAVLIPSLVFIGVLMVAKKLTSKSS